MLFSKLLIEDAERRGRARRRLRRVRRGLCAHRPGRERAAHPPGGAQREEVPGQRRRDRSARATTRWRPPMSDALADRHRGPRHRRRPAWLQLAVASSADELRRRAGGRSAMVTGVSARAAHRDRGRSTSRPAVVRRSAWRWRSRADIDVCRRADRRLRRRRRRPLVEAALQRRQARGHRQQGADRRARRGARRAGRSARASRCCSRPPSWAASRPSRRCAKAWSRNEVARVAGILNGTCNYILTEMEATGRAVRRRARRGPAPGLRRGRSDPGRRRLRRRAQARASSPRWPSAPRPTSTAPTIEGIDQVSPADIAFAARARLPHQAAGLARRTADGHRAARASRHGAAARTPLADVGGVAQRASSPKAQRRRHLRLRGPRRGRRADRRRGRRRYRRRRARRFRIPVFGRPAADADSRLDAAPIGEAACGRSYLRFLVKDEPGVIAAISRDLAEPGVSIESMSSAAARPASRCPSC